MDKKPLKKSHAALIVIFFLIILSLIPLLFINLYNGWLQSPNSINWNTNYIRGQLFVYFTSEATETQAREMLQRNAISPKNDTIFFKYPQASFHFSGKDLPSVLVKVKELDFVDSAQETVNSYDALFTGHKEFIVIFKKYVSREDVLKIVQLSSELELFEPLGKMEVIVVPKGKEKEIVDQIKKESIIKSINLEYLLGGD